MEVRVLASGVSRDVSLLLYIDKTQAVVVNPIESWISNSSSAHGIGQSDAVTRFAGVNSYSFIADEAMPPLETPPHIEKVRIKIRAGV